MKKNNQHGESNTISYTLSFSSLYISYTDMYDEDSLIIMSWII